MLLEQVYDNIRALEAVVDFPSIGSNRAESFDIAAPSAIVGDAVLEAVPLETATDFDDLLTQAWVLQDGFLRFTAQNPSGGAINPGAIRFRFVLAYVRVSGGVQDLGSIP